MASAVLLAAVFTPLGFLRPDTRDRHGVGHGKTTLWRSRPKAIRHLRDAGPPPTAAT